jgi:uncharacterized protein (TIGR02996 family)
MDLERAFLHAVAEDMDEDAVRLVFADWLEETGDAVRATYIRGTCQHARFGTGPPLMEEYHEERVRLSGTREAAWLGAGRAVWTAHLPTVSGTWLFERGIPEGTSFSGDEPVARFVRESPAVFSVPTVRTITLDCKLRMSISRNADAPGEVPEDVIRALAELPELQRVCTLRIESASLSTSQWRALVHSPHLIRLSHLMLDGSPLSDAAVTTLINSPVAPRLKLLSLAAKDYDYADWYSGMAFDYIQCVGDQGVALLAAAPALAGLHTLDLRYTRLERPAVESLLASRHLPRNLRLLVRAGFTRDALDEESLRQLRVRFDQVKC